MNISKRTEGSTLFVEVEGRLDALNARVLEGELRTSMDGITDIVFDFEKLDYIASAGIRVLVASQKAVGKQGSMTLKNLQPQIMNLMEMTGLSDVFHIE